MLALPGRLHSSVFVVEQGLNLDLLNPIKGKEKENPRIPWTMKLLN